MAAAMPRPPPITAPATSAPISMVLPPSPSALAIAISVKPVVRMLTAKAIPTSAPVTILTASGYSERKSIPVLSMLTRGPNETARDIPNCFISSKTVLNSAVCAARSSKSACDFTGPLAFSNLPLINIASSISLFNPAAEVIAFFW